LSSSLVSCLGQEISDVSLIKTVVSITDKAGDVY
jgi:hypothetical protein